MKICSRKKVTFLRMEMGSFIKMYNTAIPRSFRVITGVVSNGNLLGNGALNGPILVLSFVSLMLGLCSRKCTRHVDIV